MYNSILCEILGIIKYCRKDNNSYDIENPIVQQRKEPEIKMISKEKPQENNQENNQEIFQENSQEIIQETEIEQKKENTDDSQDVYINIIKPIGINILDLKIDY